MILSCLRSVKMAGSSRWAEPANSVGPAVAGNHLFLVLYAARFFGRMREHLFAGSVPGSTAIRLPHLYATLLKEVRQDSRLLGRIVLTLTLEMLRHMNPRPFQSRTWHVPVRARTRLPVPRSRNRFFRVW